MTTPPAPDERYAPSVRATKARATGAPPSAQVERSLRARMWTGLQAAVAHRLVSLYWSSCPVRIVVGAEHLDRFVSRGEPVILCYWHQMLFCARFLLTQRERGLQPGFLVSPSRSGEVAARVLGRLGGVVVRGSDTRTGGQALQQLYTAIRREAVSPVLTVDGPKGPAHQCKPGAALLARLTGVPLLPLSCAARSFRYLNTWDRFMLPRPFTPLAVAIGPPLAVPRDAPLDGLEPFQEQLAAALNALETEAREALSR